jgi:hypothetical protein
MQPIARTEDAADKHDMEHRGIVEAGATGGAAATSQTAASNWSRQNVDASA